MIQIRILFLLLSTVSIIGCSKLKNEQKPLEPEFITEPTAKDSDDPAIWINKEDISKSLIIGTDKDKEGALYVFDLQGKILHKSDTLLRPNNVDIAYGMIINDSTKVDIAVTTERLTGKIRIFTLPEMKSVDKGGIPVFEGEKDNSPMGISLFTRKDSLGNNEIFAIVGRKTGPTEDYLHQYKLSADLNGNIVGNLVRTFGSYSGLREIEAIAVDNELGYIYYSDEGIGIKKYYADPEKGNDELALFGTTGFAEDHEGISIYKTDEKRGYILVSNQGNNSIRVFPREGSNNNPHKHDLIVDIPIMAKSSDGNETINLDLGVPFDKGIFIAMSNDKTFHYYDWKKIQAEIDKAQHLK